jgi:hypothetical protein
LYNTENAESFMGDSSWYMSQDGNYARLFLFMWLFYHIVS